MTLFPGDLEEAAQMVRDAAAAGQSLAPTGSGSRGWYGRPATVPAVPIGTRRLDRIVHYEPDDLTVTAEAGLLFSRLQQRLADHGQWVPVNPPQAGEATLGGLLSTGATGSLRARYGSWRDFVLGMTVVTGEGQLVKSGGRVVKNVTGYDLHKLHIGALGTLGLIVQVSLKVLPLPQDRRIILAPFADRAAALRAAGVIVASQLEAASVELLCGHVVMPASSAVCLAVRLAGPSANCDRGVRETRALVDEASVLEGNECNAAWAALDDLPTAATFVCRVAAPLSRVFTLCERWPLDRGCRMIADLAAGIAYFAWDEPTVDGVVERALLALRGELGADGAVVLARAPDELRARLDVWGPLPPSYPSMLAIKRSLDPRGLWNPGRFLGEL